MANDLVFVIPGAERGDQRGPARVFSQSIFLKIVVDLNIFERKRWAEIALLYFENTTQAGCCIFQIRHDT